MMSTYAEQIIFSVAEFIDYINIAVGQRSVSVEGEISGYHLNQGKWVFFDLKDDESKIGCFAASWNLRAALEDGMQVVVHGIPRIYPKSGKFSIMVETVELRGEGALRRAFELTKRKLEHEGLFDTSRKRDLPRFPEKIGVICSRESAAYTDFMRIVNARWGGLDITLAHVSVQGAHAERDIVKAFEWFNTTGIIEGIESIVLIRGGGSLEDLQAFNSESVARAVFGSKIPVVCGIGHERDETLADYAADVRAATPTHAATLIVPDRQEMERTISNRATSLDQSMGSLVEWHEGCIHAASLKIHTWVQRPLHQMGEVIGAFVRAGQGLHNRVGLASQSLAFLERTLTQMDPLTVLKRGYTIVKKGDAVITSAKSLDAGDDLTVLFADGKRLTRVV